MLLVAAAAGLYVRGLNALWRHAGRGRGVSGWQASAFAIGTLVLAVALSPPIETVLVRSFVSHMVQHEVLMVVAAPLLVLGRPMVAWAWAVPTRWRPLLPAMLHSAVVHRPWAVLSVPLVAWTLHAAVVWLWHLPVAFESALHSPSIHAVQHATFLGTALLFWWNALCATSRRARGFAMVAVCLTMLHTSLLGALLTFSPHPWYGSYAQAAADRSLDPLVDQQLGGLVMWIPGGLSYLLAALFLASGWLRAYAAPSS